MRKLIVPALLLLALLCPRPARAEYPASGFLLQGLLGGSATIIGTGGTTTAFNVTPTLRIGGMLRPLAIAANLSYVSLATLRFGASYEGVNVFTIGPDIMPFVWKNDGGQVRLYLLFGLNVGAAISSTANRTDGRFTGGFTVGVGGNYFLHRNFALGVEAGSRTQFTPQDASLSAASTIYAALSGSFVVGR